jgi:ribosomal RNA-processing protein 17
LESVI